MSDKPALTRRDGAGHDPPGAEPAYLHIAARTGPGDRPRLLERLHQLLLAWGRWMDGRGAGARGEPDGERRAPAP